LGDSISAPISARVHDVGVNVRGHILPLPGLTSDQVPDKVVLGLDGTFSLVATGRRGEEVVVGELLGDPSRRRNWAEFDNPLEEIAKANYDQISDDHNNNNVDQNNNNNNVDQNNNNNNVDQNNNNNNVDQNINNNNNKNNEGNVPFNNKND
jgi:hypothetical protein